VFGKVIIGIGDLLGEETSWEQELYSHFSEIINAAPITNEANSWSSVFGGMHTVRDNYLFFLNRFSSSPSSVLFSVRSMNIIWENWAPLKVIVFSWQANKS
jgi:hypothetical protein